MLRRDFLLSSALLSVAPKGFAQSSGRVAYIAAAKSRLGETSFVCLDKQGDVLAEHDVLSRGHSFAYSSIQSSPIQSKASGHIAAIARRPADFCLIIDGKGNKVSEFNARAGRHFYGHGVYSPDGKYLYLTENDYGVNGSRGVIGIYEVAKGYDRIDEFDSAGIGSHEIAVSPDGSQLIVANGGIQTHPESGRKKLNLTTMQPNLAFINRVTGSLVNKAELASEFATNSLRHMAVADNGVVYVALQQQVKTNQNCLLASYDPRTKTLTPTALSVEQTLMLEHYVGDIELDSSQQVLAASSPRGNIMFLLDITTNSIQTLDINDVCGLAATQTTGQFVATSGDGRLMTIQQKGASAQVQTVASSVNFYWDNHLLSFG